MHHASHTDYDFVMDLFRKNRAVFPHIRTTEIKERIERRQVIVENGIVITYHRVKRLYRIGDVDINKGDCMLHQIVSSTQGDGTAVAVINKFFSWVNASVFLSVRRENQRAIKFYHKVGMSEVGSISWSDGKIPGVIFCKRQGASLEPFISS